MTSTDPRFPLGTPRNGCSGCRRDFTSLSLFDAHRVGTFEYDFSFDRPDGRRCIDADEIAERGWRQDAKGRWFDPASVERAREAFRTRREKGDSRSAVRDFRASEAQDGEIPLPVEEAA